MLLSAEFASLLVVLTYPALLFLVSSSWLALQCAQKKQQPRKPSKTISSQRTPPVSTAMTPSTSTGTLLSKFASGSGSNTQKQPELQLQMTQESTEETQSYTAPIAPKKVELPGIVKQQQNQPNQQKDAAGPNKSKMGKTSKYVLDKSHFHKKASTSL